MSAQARTYKLALTLVLASVLVLIWTAAAQAQTTPEDVQYGSPTTEIGGTGSGGSGSVVGDAGHHPGTGGGSGAGADSSSGTLGLTGVLPETGGPLFSLVALAGLALIGTGLSVMLRRPGSNNS